MVRYVKEKQGPLPAYSDTFYRLFLRDMLLNDVVVKNRVVNNRDAPCVHVHDTVGLQTTVRLTPIIVFWEAEEYELDATDKVSGGAMKMAENGYVITPFTEAEFIEYVSSEMGSLGLK